MNESNLEHLARVAKDIEDANKRVRQAEKAVEKAAREAGLDYKTGKTTKRNEDD